MQGVKIKMDIKNTFSNYIIKQNVSVRLTKWLQCIFSFRLFKIKVRRKYKEANIMIFILQSVQMRAK